MKDTWTTPKDFYNKLNSEFNFTLDAAALERSALCHNWYGPDHPDEEYRDAFKCDWFQDAKGGDIWLNPPYGREIGKWLEKAKIEASKGATVVCLVPSRTDTRWFHDSCIDFEIRFIKGRLKFGDSPSSAPFPSILVVMKKEAV